MESIPSLRFPRNNFSFSPGDSSNLEYEEIESRYLETDSKMNPIDSERRHKHRSENNSFNSEKNLHKLKNSKLFQKFVEKEMGISCHSQISHGKSLGETPFQKTEHSNYESFGRIRESPVRHSNAFLKSNAPEIVLKTQETVNEKELESKSEMFQPNASMSQFFATPSRSPSRARDESAMRHLKMVEDYRNYKDVRHSPNPSMGQSKELLFTTTQRFPSPSPAARVNTNNYEEQMQIQNEKIFQLEANLQNLESENFFLKEALNSQNLSDNNQNQELNAIISDYQEREVSYKEQLYEFEETKMKLLDCEAEIERLKSTISKLPNESPQNSQVPMIKKQLSDSQNENAFLKSSAKKLQDEILSSTIRIRNLEEENEMIKHSLQDYQQKFLESSSSLDELAYENSHLKNEILRLQFEAKEAEEEISYLRASSQDFQAKEKRLTFEIENSRIESQQLKSEKQRNEKIIEELRNQITHMLTSSKESKHNQKYQKERPMPPPSFNHTPVSQEPRFPQKKLQEPQPQEEFRVGNLYQQFLQHKNKGQPYSPEAQKQSKEDFGEQNLDVEKDWNNLYKRNSPPSKEKTRPYVNPSKLDNPMEKQKQIAENQLQIQDCEGILVSRQMERTQLESEYRKLQEARKKSGAILRRKAEIEERLEVIEREIGSCRVKLRSLGAF